MTKPNPYIQFEAISQVTSARGTLFTTIQPEYEIGRIVQVIYHPINRTSIEQEKKILILADKDLLLAFIGKISLAIENIAKKAQAEEPSIYATLTELQTRITTLRNASLNQGQKIPLQDGSLSEREYFLAENTARILAENLDILETLKASAVYNTHYDSINTTIILRELRQVVQIFINFITIISQTIAQLLFNQPCENGTFNERLLKPQQPEHALEIDLLINEKNKWEAYLADDTILSFNQLHLR